MTRRCRRSSTTLSHWTSLGRMRRIRRLVSHSKCKLLALQTHGHGLPDVIAAVKEVGELGSITSKATQKPVRKKGL